VPNAVERIGDALRVIGGRTNGVSAAELAEALSVSRGTASRLLNFMVAESLVEKEPAGQRYVVGLDLWLIGSSALSCRQLVDVSSLALAEAVAEHGIMLTLVVNRGLHTYSLLKAERMRGFVMVSAYASKSRIHLVAGGKAILAFGAEEDLEKFLEQGELPATETTKLTHEQLRAELDEIRRLGVAHSTSRLRLASPIFDRSGLAVAAIVATSPSEVRQPGFEEKAAPMLREVSASISRLLGYTGRSDSFD
jgi:DNA-binding IclR family transcriptional regulator